MNVALDLEFSVSDASTPDDEDVPGCPDEDMVRLWAQRAFLSAQDRSASVRVVSEAEMQRLNLEWRGKDSSTNVLSFPMQFDADFDATVFGDEQSAPLGDIALCASVINREAGEQGKLVDAHWAHMVVHGMLHLQGYDHIHDNDADDMEAQEIQILQTLGYDNPYQNHANEKQEQK